MAQDMGMTRLTVLGSLDRQLSPAERLLRTIQTSLAGQFEVFGELGRGERGKIVYLAREIASRSLVALQLVPAEDSQRGSEDYWVEVLRKLDGNVPSVDSTCPRCGQPLRGWGRFCRHCGADLSGVAPSGGPNASSDDLLRAVQDSARGRFQILGQMDRAEGGGIVYFAREVKGGKIVALRLLKEYDQHRGTEQYSIGVTQVLSSVAESLGVGGRSAPLAAPPPPPPPVRAPTPPPAAVTAPPPVTAPPKERAPSAQRPRRPLSRNEKIGLGTAAALLVAAVAWAVASRSSTGEAAPLTSDTALIDTTIPVTLAADSADVEVGGRLPRRATITVDGVPVSGTTIRLAPGTYTFRITAPGYAPTTQDISVRAGQSQIWTPQFVRGTSTSPPAPSRPPTPAPRPQQRPAPPPRDSTRDVGVSDSALPINRPVATKEDPPPAPPPTTASTCASLFSRLEWARALRACDEEARAGSVVAQRTVGTLHERGLGTAANAKVAFQWYSKSGESGDAFAQYRLGSMLLDGRGVKKNEKAAIDWFRRAAEQGQTDALMVLAHHNERGKIVKRNSAEAVALYTRAAELGSAAAQTKLGTLYAVGELVKRDDRQAFEMFRKAAEQGHTEAEFRLGDIYARGVGVQKSDSAARRWLGKAASQGHTRAKEALKRLR